MAFYWTCSFCGANLDHGERCDCRDAYKIEKAAFASDQEAQMPRSVNAQKRVDTSIITIHSKTVKIKTGGKVYGFH